jgi:hypothetical protein
MESDSIPNDFADKVLGKLLVPLSRNTHAFLQRLF